MRRRGWWALVIGAALAATGCAGVEAERDARPDGASGGPDAAADAPAGRQGEAGTAGQPAEAGAKQGRAAAAPPLKGWPLEGQPGAAVTALRWVDAGHLQIGYADGVVVDLKPAQGEARARSIGSGAPIAALAPGGRWVVLATSPVQLVDLEGASVLMEAQRVETLAATDFAEDGSRWYVSGTDGHVHIWGREKLKATMEGEELRAVLARSKPDVHAALPSVAAPIVAAGPTTITFGNPEGDVLQWDIKSQEIQTLLSMEAPVQDLAVTGRYLAVTARNGRLRVLDLEAGRFVPWSVQARGVRSHLIADAGGDRLAVERLEPAREVLLLRADTGAAAWTRPLPGGGEPCGVAVAPGAKTVAACVDGAVALLSGEDGRVLSAVRQQGGQVRWVDARGGEVRR